MTRLQVFFIVFALVYFTGCTDAYMSQIVSIGSTAEITCYSGGKVIYQGKSTGKVSTESNSDGWYFKDAETHKLVRISGDCVVIN